MCTLITRSNDVLAKTPLASADFGAVRLGDRLEHLPDMIASLFGFSKDSHPDEATRKAYEEADTLISNHSTAENVREDVYAVYKAVRANTEVCVCVRACVHILALTCASCACVRGRASAVPWRSDIWSWSCVTIVALVHSHVRVCSRCCLTTFRAGFVGREARRAGAPQE